MKAEDILEGKPVKSNAVEKQIHPLFGNSFTLQFDPYSLKRPKELIP
jgi:hypothetical protein